MAQGIVAIRVGTSVAIEWSMALSRQACQAENITGDHESENLPFAVGHEPVTECHPMREHEGRAGHVTLAHDVGIRLEAFLVEAHPMSARNVLVRGWPRKQELSVSNCRPIPPPPPPSAKKMLRIRDFMHEGYLRNYL